jgi:integrase
LTTPTKSRKITRYKTICKDDKVFNVLWDMKRKGKADQYIRNVDKALSALSKRCDLEDPEFVKNTIAKIESVGYKRNLTYAYDIYAKYHKIEWERPRYWVPQKVPKIPLEKHIEAIIGCACQKTATATAISKDTGLRPIELCNLTPEQIDPERGIIYPESAKHGKPRALKLTRRTLNMLNTWIAKKNIGQKQKIFGKWTSDNYGKSFRYYRNQVAKKLGDHSIKSIKLYNLRHYFATMLLRKCNNIVIVKEKLGHNNINHTLIYAQIVDLLDEDNFTCKIAETVERAKKLIEKGYEYITGEYDDGGKLFKKRK